MGDILFLAVVLGFFATAVLFVRACELILRPRDTGREDVRET